MLWFAFALMTGAALACALWPLWRARGGDDGQAAAIAFHKAQLAEIERDVARGQLPADEAAGARAEAARRLIAASDAAAANQPDAAAPASSRAPIAIALVILVSVVAGGLYSRLGRPDLPDEPILARASDPAATGDLGAALAKVEAHLRDHPDDGLGFKVVAPVYMHVGRFEDAANAYQEALRLLGEDAQLRADYGEALTAAAGGVVTAQAQGAFERAVADQADLPKARYYLALAAEQEGDSGKATAAYESLLRDAPPNAAWLGVVREHLAALKNAPPAEEAKAIAALDPKAQQAAISGMVDKLAARLAANGDDPQGWLRLIRAYCVLQQTDKAKEALAQARKALAADAAAGRDLDALSREFNLGS